VYPSKPLYIYFAKYKPIFFFKENTNQFILNISIAKVSTNQFIFAKYKYVIKTSVTTQYLNKKV